MVKFYYKFRILLCLIRFHYNLGKFLNNFVKCIPYILDFSLLEPLLTDVQILANEPENYTLFTRSSAIHYTASKIRSCNLLEFTYKLPMQTPNCETQTINSTHSNTTCKSITAWNPANGIIVVQAVFEYGIENSSSWTLSSGNGTIQDYSPVKGKYQRVFNKFVKIIQLLHS